MRQVARRAQFALSATQAVLDDSAVLAKPTLETLYGAPVSQADVVLPQAFTSSTPTDAKGLEAPKIVPRPRTPSTTNCARSWTTWIAA